MNKKTRFCLIIGIILTGVSLGVVFMLVKPDAKPSPAIIADTRPVPVNIVPEKTSVEKLTASGEDEKRNPKPKPLQTVKTNAGNQISDENYELPQIILDDLEQNNPTLKKLLDERGETHGDPTKYAYIDSLDELISIIEEWHSLKQYEAGRFSSSEDLLNSARRLACVKDENWPIANWYLGQLLQDIGYIKESAYVFNNLIKETGILVNETMRLEAMFKLALTEFSKPTSYWWGGESDNLSRNMSITQPEKLACDVAKELFEQIIQSTDKDDELHKLAQVFSEASEEYKLYVSKQKSPYLKYATVLDSITELKTSLILAQDLYNSNVNASERGHVLNHTKRFVESADFREYVENLPIEDKRFWLTNVAWMLHEERKHIDIVDTLEPLTDTETWNDNDAYIRSQYYLTYAYNALGEDQKAKKVIDRLTSEGFVFDEMQPAMKLFFIGMKEKIEQNNSL